MFDLSPAAARELRRSLDRGEDAAGMALRVAARLEADGTLAFGMGLDEPREGDLPLQLHGVELLIAPPSQPLLADARLDFVEVQAGRFGFVFVEQDRPASPPAGTSACGSGSCGGCSE